MSDWPDTCPICGCNPPGLDISKATGNIPYDEAQAIARITRHLYFVHCILGDVVEKCFVCGHDWGMNWWVGPCADHLATHTWHEVSSAIALFELGKIS